MSARGSGIGFAAPIFKGQEERWRRFLQELRGSCRKDYEDLRRRLGVTRQSVWLVRTLHGEMFVTYLECGEPEKIGGRLAASTQPFDVWLKGKLSEFHGCDFNRIASGWSPELVFEAGEDIDTTSGDGLHDGAREARDEQVRD